MKSRTNRQKWPKRGQLMRNETEALLNQRQIWLECRKSTEKLTENVQNLFE